MANTVSSRSSRRLTIGSLVQVAHCVDESEEQKDGIEVKERLLSLPIREIRSNSTRR